MSKKKAAYYVVWGGKIPGIYTDWETCAAQVKGVTGAKYKGFVSLSDAEQAFREGPEKHLVKGQRDKGQSTKDKGQSAPVLPALAVDAACSGNPGVMEFRGVIADTGTEIFRRGPFPEGTNNIGEFLAIVLGLAYLKQNNLPWVLYSDSKTAIAWVREKRCKTKMEWTMESQDLFMMVRKAEMWLHDNTWTTPIYKWDTKAWGEIPADFGRK